MNIIRYNETLKIINFTVQLVVIIYLEKKKRRGNTDLKDKM